MSARTRARSRPGRPRRGSRRSRPRCCKRAHAVEAGRLGDARRPGRAPCWWSVRSSGAGPRARHPPRESSTRSHAQRISCRISFAAEAAQDRSIIGGPRWTTRWTAADLEPLQLVAPDGTRGAPATRHRRARTTGCSRPLRDDGRHPRARRGVRQPPAPGPARALPLLPAGRRRRRSAAPRRPARHRLAVPAVPRARRVPRAGHRPGRHRAGVAGHVARRARAASSAAWRPCRSPSARRRCTPSARRWRRRWLGDDGVTVAFIGDGATSEGDVHEALNLAAVQDAPCIFYVQNNGWAISTPVRGPVPRAVDRPQGDRLRHARRAGRRQRRRGLLPRGGRGRRAGPRRRRADADRGHHLPPGPAHHLRRPHPLPQRRRGRGVGGRSTRSTASGATSRHVGALDDELERPRPRERAAALRTRLRDAVVRRARPDPLELFDHVFASPTPALLAQRAELAAELRAGPDVATMTMVQAIGAALARRDGGRRPGASSSARTSARQGGVFRVTDGLQRRSATDRCFDTPLAESSIIGAAIGMAMRGFRPVPEIQFDGFTYPAFDQIASHLAKYRTRTRGLVSMPVTVRVPVVRRHRLARAPLRIDRDLLGAHGRPEGRRARRPRPTPTRCCATRSSPTTP